MRAYDIIKKKRDSEELKKEELQFLISGYLNAKIPDYQISAFLMAVLLNGMTEAETLALTEVMLHSGTTLDLSDISSVKLDKHSTGGVGDKVSIILAPLMAAMGVTVPMISGRALGHTGGTLDKLQSIPGFRTDLSLSEFKENLKDIGVSIIGQTDEIAPADRKLYSLRDVTATVDSIPLIASSIMSKKLAEGINGLLLDVKAGSGAFMKDRASALQLAKTMVSIGNKMGVKTVALVTNMDEPLGRTIGNSLEIKECISLLKGRGASDLMDLTLTLSAWMLNLTDAVAEETELKKMTENTRRNYKHEAMEFIEKGDVFKKFVEMIDAQHGDPEVAFKPNLLPLAKNVKQIKAGSTGFIQKLNAESCGTASMLLGAGRKTTDDSIDPSAGIILGKKVGDFIEADEPVAMFHYNDAKGLKDAEDVFYSGLLIAERDPSRLPMVFDVVTK